jgi:hypothetical protein
VAIYGEGKELAMAIGYTKMSTAQVGLMGGWLGGRVRAWQLAAAAAGAAPGGKSALFLSHPVYACYPALPASLPARCGS